MSSNGKRGLVIHRVFSTEGVDPFDQVEWDERTAEIKDLHGNTVFRQERVWFPKTWSQQATNVVASKYFYGDNTKGNGSPSSGKREFSVAQLVNRVANTIAEWGRTSNYFATTEDAHRFRDELKYLLLNQYGSFNSPVWFNVGLHHQYGISGSASNYIWSDDQGKAIPCEDAYKYPQGSACFIQSVKDDMASIMKLATSEAMLFKYGSGTGTDLSPLRSTREKLSGGGKPSGPVSFMRVYDSIAGVIKSGGVTRRAAKMQILRCDHPDIMEFIECKTREEAKAHALIREGYEANFNGEAYSSVMFQNANLSVRCTDGFMDAVVGDMAWETVAVTTREPIEKHRAREIMDKIAEGTWRCGDPGVQYDDTINLWHTCPNSGRINASNPCSEYVFLDDSACNLASLNLLKFLRDDGSFDVDRFRSAVHTFIIAQDILVDRVSYPTPEIAENSHRFRPLGLGYANLGALLMSLGLPYDSEDGRSLAGAITAIMHAEANVASAMLARELGAFDGYLANREPMLRVMGMHQLATGNIGKVKEEIDAAVRSSWSECISEGQRWGYRNSQVTLLAPTGTIAFMMDCDTTGIEPDIALVKYKTLAGGGTMKIVNRIVPVALARLKYSEPQIIRIMEYVDQNDTIEGAPGLKSEHLPVFDCAFPPAKGGRSIHHMGHLKMMAAVQPFLSGAISKTVNMPEGSTVEDIRNAYIEGWKLGLKCVAIYRENSKKSQPLSTKKDDARADHPPSPMPAVSRPDRNRLPDTRNSLTHKFDIQGHEGYINVGFYPDGRPGELFVTMAKEGSTIAGMMDAFGIAISIGLQYGVPLETFIEKFIHTRFEPSGFTKNPDVPIAKSIVDYIFRWMQKQFSSPFDVTEESVAPAQVDAMLHNGQHARFQSDAPACDACGSITVRSGSCYRCLNCGSTTGCS